MIRKYLHATFPGLILQPSLYHQWDIGIHFKLSEDLYQFQSETTELNFKYFNQVYNQAISLFNDIFSNDDELFLVTNLYQRKDYGRSSKRKMKTYHHYIKDKSVRYNLMQETLPYIFDDEEDTEENSTSQFSLKCCKQDIRYILLIKAICNQDFPPLKPRLHNPNGLYELDVFFINVTKNVILYIYDDRGCEVIARDIEMIRPLYEKYAILIDEYDRKEVEQKFG